MQGEEGATTAHQLLLAERYELLGLLGRGAMGTVYRVRDRELDEDVALKLFRKDLASVPRMLARFRTEVKLARRVTHPNVARTFDIGRHDGDWFLTMEYVRGVSLGTDLARTGPPAPARAIAIVSQICAGVAAAHDVGVVHRDLKPENVMLTAEGRAIVTDFGIARLREEDDAATASLVGTPAYMAPEQVTHPDAVGPSADVYAIGAILFELLTGRRAWPGGIMAALVGRLDAEPPDPRELRPDVPPALAAIVMRAMSRDPARRQEAASSLGEDLAALSIPHGAPPPRAGPPRSVHLAPGSRTVAIQPFENGGAAVDDYLAVGLTQDLLDALSLVPNLRVSRGEGPAVLATVRGRIFRVADSVRITASLVGVDNAFVLWSTRRTTPFVALLEATDAMAREIAATLAIEPSAAHTEYASLDAEAIELYLRARLKYRTEFTAEAKEAPALFERALAHAPDHPTLLAAYALSLTRGGGPFSSQDAGATLAKARTAAERASRLAPHLPDARVALAHVHLAEGRPLEAADELRVAIGAGYTNAELLLTSGWLLAESGELELGMDRLRLSRGLDPHMHVADIELARAFALLRDWDTADELLARVEVDPGLTYVSMMQRVRFLAGWRGDRERARAFLAELETRPELLARPGMRPQLETILGGAVTPATRDGLEQAARATAAVPRQRAFALQMLAELHAISGDAEAAFEALARADAAGLFDLAWMDRCPALDALRADVRFGPLRESVAARTRGVVERLGV